MYLIGASTFGFAVANIRKHSPIGSSLADSTQSTHFYDNFIIYGEIQQIALLTCLLHSKEAAIVVLCDLRWKAVPLSHTK
jgi:hypothetical protein